MDNRTRAGNLTITLEHNGQQLEMTINTRVIGEWHLHRYQNGSEQPEEKYWTVSHQCGVAAALGVKRDWAQKLLYRLADLPACPVSPDVARQMISTPALATPEFREWYKSVGSEVGNWRKEFAGRHKRRIA